VDVHDLAVDGGGHLVFVNTLFSCLATVSQRYSFVPLWRPGFISKLAAEDRCHLNGVALVDGAPRYVTACSRSDVADGWRARRRDGGCVIAVPKGLAAGGDVASEIAVDGLSMPHSPRWHRDQLWLHTSGTGEFGYVDLNRGRFEPVAFCPGYLRGLALCDGFAVVGLSKPRDKAFAGLVLDEELRRRDGDARCGLGVIDLASGDLVHWLWIEGVVTELYDVAVLPGVRRPTALGFKTDEIRRTIAVPPSESG
jgi:uncharacterized protein (TIGR03032 family)